MQDAAHGSLLRSARQQLHARIAESARNRFSRDRGRKPARDCSRSTMPRSGARRKIHRLLEQGRSWVGHPLGDGRSGSTIAKGLDQLALLPDDLERQRRELEFRSALGGVLQAAKAIPAPETGRAHARARGLWEQLGSPSEFLPERPRAVGLSSVRGDLGLALHLAGDLLRLSRQRNDFIGLVLGHASLRSKPDVCRPVCVIPVASGSGACAR